MHTFFIILLQENDTRRKQEEKAEAKRKQRELEAKKNAGRYLFRCKLFSNMYNLCNYSIFHRQFMKLHIILFLVNICLNLMLDISFGVQCLILLLNVSN